MSVADPHPERTTSVTAAALVLARELTDTGRRTDLDDAITAFGFDRAELEAELEADKARNDPITGPGSAT